MATYDKQRRPIPLMFMISMHERENIELEQMFSCLVKWFDISPKVVMSDCALNYAAIVKKYFPDSKHLLCIWDVYRAWSGQIKKHFKNNAGAKFAKLVEIQKNLNKNEMIRQLNIFLNDSPVEFKKYFDLYTKNLFKWAAFARKGMGVNVNTALESFH